MTVDPTEADMNMAGALLAQMPNLNTERNQKAIARELVRARSEGATAERERCLKLIEEVHIGAEQAKSPKDTPVERHINNTILSIINVISKAIREDTP